jgi:hypothetical protein
MDDPMTFDDPIGRLLERLAQGLAVFGGLVLTALTLISLYSVLMRNLVGAPIQGDFELVQMGCAVSVAAFLPFTQLRNGNVFVDFFTARASSRTKARLESLDELRLNILNQNIEMMCSAQCIEWLRELTGIVTCTTAHPKYTTLENRLKWDTPVHFLPAWMAPDDPLARRPEDKEEIMIVSPDPSPHKERILANVRARFPQLSLVEVKRMRFTDFIDLANRARWSITFGEGVDDYLLQPAMRGGVSFAVFNEAFFTPEWRSLRTVYASYDEMERNLVRDMEDMHETSKYQEASRAADEVIKQTHGMSAAKTQDALRQFYRKEFTFS